MNSEERLKQAQALLQLMLQTLERDYGFAVESTLQIEPITSSYATSRAVLVLKPVPNWQPFSVASPEEGEAAPMAG